MSRLITDNFGYLQLLADCAEHQRQFLLSSASPQQVHTLCEVCYNLLRGAVPLSEMEKQELKHHANFIRDLSNTSVPFKTKKQIISQQGSGFVDKVVSPLLSTLSLFLL